MLNKSVLILVAMMAANVAFAGWQESTPARKKIGGFEASGIVFDPYSETLVLADDGGNVYSSDGSKVKIGGDLESVATDGNGFIYVGTEGCEQGVPSAPKIKQLFAPPLVGVVHGEWSLTGFPLPSSCNTGMEGLTWVPNGEHPYANNPLGGVFYASSMSDGKIYVFAIDPSSVESPVTLLNGPGFAPLTGQVDISDLYYDPSQKLLFVLYDTANKVVQVDISKNVPTTAGSFRLPTTPKNQEGITFLPSCNQFGITTIYLADDPPGNGYYGFSGYPGVCSTDERKVTTISQTVPLNMFLFGGASHQASVTVQNTGTTTWSGSTFGLYPIEESTTVAYLGASESVAPGQTKTFSILIRPTKSGALNFQWRMKQGNSWFGAPTAVVTSFVTF